MTFLLKTRPMQHSKKSSCWSKLHLRQRQVGRNLVVVGYILCSHFRVKMTSWEFQGPTHTGHKLRSQSRGDSTVRGDFTVKGDSTVKRDPTVSVTSGSHLNHIHFEPWVFFPLNTCNMGYLYLQEDEL